MKKIWLALAFASALSGVAAQAQPCAGMLFVVSKQTHTLSMVDAATLQVVAHVPIGEDPHEVVVGPDHRTAFVSNYGEGTLRTIATVDLVSRKPLPPIDITPLRGDHGLWVHGNTLWFTAEGSKAIATLDPVSHRLESVVGTGQDKTHLVWVSRDGTRVLASNAASATLSFFHQVIVSPVLTPGAPPPPASYTQPAWRQQLVATGPGAEGFAVSPDESEAWVGDSTGAITIVDIANARVKERIQPGVPGANRLKFTPDGARILVTMHTGKELVVLDSRTHAVVARIPIEERGASGIAIQPDGKRAFIACPRDHYVAVVDLTTLEMIAKIDAGREPDGLAWWGR